MKTFAYNVLIVVIVASPLLVLESLRERSPWIDDNHDRISIALWALVLLAVYLYVLPSLGLEINPRFF